MRSLFVAILLTLLATPVCRAQYSISGKVTDTLNAALLPKASVVLMRASDSVMEQYTRSRNDGTFAMNVKHDGKYIIMISFPGFADYIDNVSLKDNKPVSLGDIYMVSRAHLLNEFVLTRQVAAIKIKGDTTEYVADSFQVKENATVEDLLKKLPGLQVDKNGKVTAQGEEVKKILVDGEEFFSDDPAVVTKNLQSSMVDKVQVYDKKSDQTEFTGIDDGQREKTINLQLKEDKKHGYFGKVDAGAGTDGYYQNQGMINNFKGKQQLSVFGIASNTDQVGLGWSDNEKYGSSNMTTEITDAGDVINYFSNNDNSDFQSWDGKYNGEGLPQVFTGGAHYANKWDEDKDHLTGNYRYAMQDVDINSNTITQNILPDNTQNITRQNSTQSSRGQRHSADATYEWKIDSTSSIKLTANAGYKNTTTQSVYNTDVYYDDGANTDSLINNTGRRITSTATAQDINSDLLYKKKFNKKGRTLSIDFKENYKQSQSNGYLYSNSLFSAGYDSLIDQRKQINTNTLAFQGKVAYTEPLSKVTFLLLDYSTSVNNSTTLNYSYDKPPGTDAYTMLDTFYSSNYKFNVLTNTGGASLRWVYDKVNFSVGTDVSDAKYKQTDLLNRDTTYNYDYFNLFPKASFNYKFSKQTALSFNYMGSTKQPTIDQIAPLHQNTDPLNIEIGNPNLKQQFQNTVSSRFNDYKVISSRYIWAGASMTFINDAISTAQNTDPLTGIRTYRYVNVNGNYSGWMYGGYGFKIKKLKVDMSMDGSANINHIASYVNGVQNISNDNAYSVGMNVNYDKENKYSFYFRPSVTYNDNQSSISTFNASYWTSDNNFTGSYELPLKFEVGSSLDWYLRQRTVIFDENNDVLKWNAYVSKKFLKGDKLELRATVYDILNQNTGFSRSAQDNIITQQQYNTIRRHAMISLIWNFSKTPAAPAGNVEIK